MDLVSFLWESKYVLLLIATVSSIIFYIMTSQMRNCNRRRKKSSKKVLLRGIKSPCSVILSEKKMLNHDTMFMKLSFPGQNLSLGLDIGEHIKIHGKDKDGELISRSYTPISRIDQKGSLDLLIKVYFPNERFPDGGQLTQFLHGLEEGSRVRIAGPKGKVKYQNKGYFFFKKKNMGKTFKKISMVAGGSGITPLYQIIQHLRDEGIGTFQVSLIFANKFKKDIVLEKELKELADCGMIKLFFTLDNPDKDWKGLTGFVNKEKIEKCFPTASNDHLVMTCGPRLMNKDVIKSCTELGFKEDNIFKF